MKKKILVIMLTVGVCLGMIGCSPDHSVERLSSDSKETTASSMFVEVEYDDLNGVVCYQKDTKVMYWVSRGRYTYGNITVLLNPDGSPMVYGVDFHEEE